MESKGKQLIIFSDIFDDDPVPQFGILFENGWVMCLCCGSYMEPDEFDILEVCGDIGILNEILKCADFSFSNIPLEKYKS